MTIKDGEIATSQDVLTMTGRALCNIFQLMVSKTNFGTSTTGKCQVNGGASFDSSGDIKSFTVFSATAVDDFSTGAIDTNLWSVSNVTESGGQMVMEGAPALATLDGVNAPDLRNGNSKSAVWFQCTGNVFSEGGSTLRIVDESANKVDILTGFITNIYSNAIIKVGIDPTGNTAGASVSAGYTSGKGVSFTGTDISSLVNTDEWHLEIQTENGTTAKIDWVRWLTSASVNATYISDTYTEPEGVTIYDCSLFINKLAQAGTSATFHASADGGSNWELLTASENEDQFISHRFTNTGTDLRIKATMTSATGCLVYELIDWGLFYNLSTGA